LIDGAVKYDAELFDAPPEGTMLICCAKPISDLQVDL
jgi:hypothetical protein